VAYCHQSSGKLQCINMTLKQQLGKICQGTHLQLEQLLPIDLLRIRLSPTNRQVSPLLRFFLGIHAL
jgi:hypothetical protein